MRKNDGNSTLLTVVDVGASVGAFSVHCAKKSLRKSNYKRIQVFAVEPIAKIASKIPAMPNLKILNYGVLERHRINSDGKSTMQLMTNSELSTFEKVNLNIDERLWGGAISAAIQVQETVQIACKTLEEIIDQNQIQQIDFLKIDTQGSDLGVIQSAGKHIRKVKSCVLEFPYSRESRLYENEILISEGISQMQHLGFIPIRIVPNGGGEANVFFVNSEYPVAEYFKLEQTLDFENSAVLKIGFRENSIRKVIKIIEEKTIIEYQRLKRVNLQISSKS